MIIPRKMDMGEVKSTAIVLLDHTGKLINYCRQSQTSNMKPNKIK